MSLGSRFTFSLREAGGEGRRRRTGTRLRGPSVVPNLLFRGTGGPSRTSLTEHSPTYTRSTRPGPSLESSCHRNLNSVPGRHPVNVAGSVLVPVGLNPTSPLRPHNRVGPVRHTCLKTSVRDTSTLKHCTPDLLWTSRSLGAN